MMRLRAVEGDFAEPQGLIGVEAVGHANKLLTPKRIRGTIKAFPPSPSNLMTNSMDTSRRGFLQSGLAAGAFLALPASVYRGAFAADEKPSEKVRIGIIGVGGQGKGNMNA